MGLITNARTVSVPAVAQSVSRVLAVTNVQILTSIQRAR